MRQQYRDYFYLEEFGAEAFAAENGNAIFFLVYEGSSFENFKRGCKKGEQHTGLSQLAEGNSGGCK